MNNLRLLISLTFLLLSCTGPGYKQADVNGEINGTVVRIVDGDTFDLLAGSNSLLRIRLNGIDCPERGQDYYRVAKDALAEYIFQREVKIIAVGKDRYGRIIANVFINGQNINLMMVRDGYAWHYKKYSSNNDLANAENNARVSKRGLWVIPNPIAPWDFRHKH